MKTGWGSQRSAAPRRVPHAVTAAGTQGSQTRADEIEFAIFASPMNFPLLPAFFLTTQEEQSE
jgi:hypothetical protein